MIILDTNVLSEPLKPRSDIIVDQWLDRQMIETLFITAINIAELYEGIHLLPEGKRKSELKSKVDRAVAFFKGRVLDFDEQAARVFGVLKALTQSKGFTMNLADAQIAAIAKAHGYTVATRDFKPFEAAGISVINPWTWTE